jgi:tape measure domain-containing protein
MATVETLRVEYASRIAAQAKADQDALLGMAKAMETVGDKGKVTDEVLKRSTQTYGRLVKDIDGVAAATTKLERAETAHATRVNVVMDAYRRGEITLAKAQQDIARLNANFEQTTNKIVASGKAIEERFTPPLQRSVAGMKSATDASRSFAEQTGQTTSAIRQMGMQQGGLVGAFATGGVFAVGMAAATAAVAAFGTAMRAIPVAGDAARASIARLSATVGDMGVASTVFDKLTASSRQTGIAVAESAGSFQRFSIAASDVGATNEQVLSLVAGLQKFAIVSGASVQETGAATQQLGQALASGVLQGDELRSILENMPLFAQSLARELGTSIGNLRTLGAEGKLTAEVVFPAMLRAVQGVDDVFGQMPVTMARAQQQFDVAAQSFLVHLDQALGFSEKLTRALQIAANMVDKIRGFAGGATGAERMAELVAGVATGSATVSAYDQAIQDARNANADPQAIAGLERTRNDAAADLRKFRDELGQINKEAVLRDEAEWEASQEKRLAAEYAAGVKSTQVQKSKYDAQYKIESEYTTELAKLDKARNTGAVSEVDYLKISTGLLKERDEALGKLNKTEDVRRAGIDRTTNSIRQLVDKSVEQSRKEQDQLHQQIRAAEETAGSQERIAAAYDGTAESITRAANEEKAFAAVRDKFEEGSTEAAAAQRRYADALNRSSDATKELDQAQRSVSAIMDTLSNAADRVGQALVDAFISGSGRAVNFGNVVRGVVASVVTDFVKLAAINPLRNALFGGGAPTLSAGLGVLTGGNAGVSASATGGLNIMNAASNVSTFGGITDALGLTDFAGRLSGIGEYLGLTGSNGLFGGIGNSITSLLSTGINGVGLGAATNAALANVVSTTGVAGAFGPAAPSSVLAAQGGATIGGVLSGVGLGFGAGSLAGGFLQSSLGKVGPAPTIGAGLGAAGGAALGSIIPGIGTVLGGLLGGLLGGGGGGLIGPRAASPFSATGLNATDGMLSVGQTFSQIVDVSQEVATLQQQTAQINSILAASNLRIANAVSFDNYGQSRIIGGNTGQWLNFGQGDGRPGSIADAFSELRFSSTEDTLNRALQGKAFANLEELQATVARITTFVNDTAPALIALGKTETTYGVGSLAATITELSRQFDDAIAMARELGHEEDALTAARATAIATAQKSVNEVMDQSKMGFDLRYWQAKATNDNDPRLAFDASLVAFDVRAGQERAAFEAQLLGILGDSGRTSALYLDQMAQLDRVLYEERLTLLTQFNSQALQSDQSSLAARARGEQSALATITSIADYAASLPFSDKSPMTGRAQYSLALGNFQSIAAGIGEGDFNALSQLPAAADQLLGSSRNLFGSGQQYATDFASVQAVLRGAVSQSPEDIVAAAIRASEAQQTAVLGGLIEKMVEKLDAILAETRLQAMRPAA